ncbi:MAG: hypothetical protein M3422_21610 [Actinomycetota bacterium]|nr:hypothetical protein [Actinomycetota bacterium]
MLRTTGIALFEVMRAHLTDPSRPDSWSDLSFDFSGGTYDAVPLWGCHFAKEVSFTDARFVGLDRRAGGRNKGWISFRQSVFSGGLSFFQVTVVELVRRVGDGDLPRVRVAPAHLVDGVLTLPAEKSERVVLELTAGSQKPGPSLG